MVRTNHPLLCNYVFIHASEAEIYRMKRCLPQYNFLPRVREKDDAYYPSLSDVAMENLKWVTASYSDVLPVLSVPVFDILRVMTTRILKRKSPFHPDKTHLHHMLIRLGCSHAATTPPPCDSELEFLCGAVLVDQLHGRLLN